MIFLCLISDVCRDTSDSDSYSTDGIATMEVLEYEVNSTSSDSEDLYSHDSSSGTDVNSQNILHIHRLLNVRKSINFYRILW